MNTITTVVAKAGLLPKETLAEFKRWGLMIEEPGPAPTSLEDVVIALEEALHSEGLVLTRETDFAAIDYFLKTQVAGTLHVVVRDGEDTRSADIECTFGKMPTGEYIIRWYSDSISDVLTNGETYLKLPTDECVYFRNIRELFFGNTKAFMVCTPMQGA